VRGRSDEGFGNDNVSTTKKFITFYIVRNNDHVSLTFRFEVHSKLYVSNFYGPSWDFYLFCGRWGIKECSLAILIGTNSERIS
jgi:hypothetical protein